MARTTSSNIIQAMENNEFFVEDETPVGSINGTNTTFTLADSPNPVASLEVRRNGLILTLTTDYSLSSDTITMVTAPRTGMTLRCDYRVEPV